jgi:hypothetical protein
MIEYRSLAVTIQPFIVEQQVILLNNGVVEKIFPTTISDLVTTISQICDDYPLVTEITFFGSAEYNERFINNLKAVKNYLIVKEKRL